VEWLQQIIKILKLCVWGFFFFFWPAASVLWALCPDLVRTTLYVFSFTLQQSNSRPGVLISEVFRSYPIRHAYPEGLPWKSDHPIAQAVTCPTHNQHKIRNSVPSAGIEPVILTFERPQTYAFDWHDYGDRPQDC
jgi:hypothetical protein